MSSKKLTPILLFILSVLFTTTSLALSMAYLISEDKLVNEFDIGNVESLIHETFDGTSKEDVYIENTGNVPIYARGDILVYFEDEDGNIDPKVPVLNQDYSLSLGSAWKKIDGQYYYQGIIQAGDSSSNLINTCTNLSDKKLVVEVLIQAIQANSTDALQDAWNLTTITGIGD